MYYKQIMIFCLLIVSFTNALAQKVTIYGKVIDENGAPIPYITIVGNKGENGVETDSNGDYSLSLNARDTISLTIRSQDFATITKKPSLGNHYSYYYLYTPILILYTGFNRYLQNIIITEDGVTTGTLSYSK